MIYILLSNNTNVEFLKAEPKLIKNVLQRTF